MGAHDLVADHHRCAHHRPVATDPLEVGATVVRIGEDVLDLVHPPVDGHPSDQRRAVADDRVLRDEVDELRRQSARPREHERVILHEVDLRDLRAEEPPGAVDDRVEDLVTAGGAARRRGREDLEDVARGPQLLLRRRQPVGELVGTPDRLVARLFEPAHASPPSTCESLWSPTECPPRTVGAPWESEELDDGVQPAPREAARR